MRTSLVAVAIVMLAAVVGCGRKAPGYDQILQGVRARENMLQDIRCVYDVEHIAYLDRQKGLLSGKGLLWTESSEWAWKDGMELIETKWDDGRATRDVFDGSRFYTWSSSSSTGFICKNPTSAFDNRLTRSTPGHFLQVAMFQDVPRSLSATLARASRANRLEVSRNMVALDGEDCVEVRLRDPLCPVTICLAPKRGWMPVKIEYRMKTSSASGLIPGNKEHLLGVFQVKEFQEVATDEGTLSIPSRALYSHYSPPEAMSRGGRDQLMTLQELHVNEGIEDKEFSPQWPVGYTVRDRDLGRKYFVEEGGALSPQLGD